MISVIILTFNEDKHIRRAIQSIRSISDDIIIVDSFSKDNTINISKKFKTKIFKNKFINQAQQFNWALNNVKIKNNWILRLDADEYLSKELTYEIKKKLPLIDLNKEINGICLTRKQFFMRKLIRFGGRGKLIMLRLFRKNFAKCENRLMDEHIVIKKGKIISFKNYFYDDNFNNFKSFKEKHKKYALREAEQYLLDKKKQKKTKFKYNLRTIIKKFLVKNVYYKLPYQISSFLYFLIRYIFLLGFLDGKIGFQYHYTQGYWYRRLVGKLIEDKINNKN
jgi:glycosyltransferase involved in cell wall biosynthesis